MHRTSKYCFDWRLNGSISAMYILKAHEFLFVCFMLFNIGRIISIKVILSYVKLNGRSQISQSIQICYQMMKMTLLLALVCLLLPSTQSLKVQSHQSTRVFTMAEYNTLVSILKTPYVIEYTGDWCYLCKSQNTMLEEVEKEFDGEWALIKIDVDQPSFETMTKSIVSFPALDFYKNGAKVFQQRGTIDDVAFKQYIDQYLM